MKKDRSEGDKYLNINEEVVNKEIIIQVFTSIIELKISKC
jgi:hypothetical protein